MIDKAKGVRDLQPEQALTKEKIIDVIRQQFKLYGFYPVENPVLERYETLAAKYAGGQEILKETFKLIDQGGRELALRYDFTVPLARYVASNPSVKLPLKRYIIGQVFRDGPVKLGRYREFTQADADIIGSASIIADAECVNLAFSVFDKLGIKAEIKVNNRTLMDSILGYLGMANKKEIILAIDKLEKLSLDDVKKELKAKGMDDNSIKKLLSIISIKGSNKEMIAKMKKLLGENAGIKELEELTRLVNNKRLKIVLSLARGLEYYTGNVFEAFSAATNSSIAAGGRYDDMIGRFIGSSQRYPAVGISFGVDVIYDILGKEEKETDTKIFVIPINTEKQAYAIIKKLRESGINADMDVMSRGISRNLEYASKLGIPYVLIIGKKELSKKKVKLRDMKSGKEKMMTLKQTINELA